MILSTGLSGRSALAAISADIKNGSAATSGLAEIAAAVTAQVPDLGGEDAAKRGAAREKLASEVNSPGNQPFSSLFLDAYAKQINAQLLPLASNPDAKIRLNVAIVVARVAEKANSTQLLPITTILLADKNEAVIAWGLKAAQGVLPALLQPGSAATQQQKLFADVNAQASHATLVPLVYEALSLNYTNNPVSKAGGPEWQKMVQAVEPEVLKLLTTRVGLYGQGVPPEPLSDRIGIQFLVDARVLARASAAQQLQTVQLISDLASVSAQRLQGGAEPKDQLTQISLRSIAALSAAALIVGNQPLSQELERISKSNPGFLQQVGQIYPKLKTVPAWSALKAPPVLGAVGGSTGGATGGSTSGATSAPATSTAK